METIEPGYYAGKHKEEREETKMIEKEIKPIDLPEETRTVNQISTMPEVIQYALQNNAGVEKLEKMMELHERYEKNEAKKAYHAAMTAFKADPPKIEKDAHVNFTTQKGRTEYNHATLANVTSTINKALSNHGLSAAWETDQAEAGISVTCKITHVLGHSESTKLTAGADNSGGKNAIQSIGSTVTYLQRYTLLALTGLATHEQDNDGAGSGVEFITEEQIETLNKLIESTGTDLGKFLSFMGGVESLVHITKGNYNKALNGLKAKDKKVKK